MARMPKTEADLLAKLREYGWHVPSDGVRPMNDVEWRDHNIQLIARHCKTDKLIAEDWKALVHMIATVRRDDLRKGWDLYVKTHHNASDE